jgi:type II secretory pathway pseudopilin PulG
MNLRSERGLSLMEVTVVIVLAAVMTLGLLGFYLNSQATWVDASSQAMAQRDATLLLETLTAQVRGAAAAEVYDSPDGQHQGLILRNRNLVEIRRFWWNGADSLVHEAWGDGAANPLGAPVPSRIERFQLSVTDSLVHLDSLVVVSANGDRVPLSSTMAFYNR